MRNLKRALSLAVASVMLLGMMVVGTSADFSDVKAAHNEEAIAVMEAAGIMIGSDGKFNPDQKVTRNEAAVVITNLLGLKAADYAGTSPFTDVPAWAEPYVAACYTTGITSGMGANYYGATENVTTAQAGLMLMKALGYFQYGSDFGDDWQLAVVTKASEIDLYDGLDVNARTPLDRNDVAQLVLNALEATMVKGKQTGTNASITAPGVTVEFEGTVEYNNVYSEANYAGAIKAGTSLQLGEDLFEGDLKKVRGYVINDYGAPSVEWTFDNESVGKFAIDPEKTYAVDFDDEEYDDLVDADYDFAGATVYVNGKAQNGVTAEDVADRDYKGTTVELYSTDDNNDKVISHVVIKQGYLAKVTNEDEKNIFVTVYNPWVSDTGVPVYYADNTKKDNDTYDKLSAAYDKDDYFMIYTSEADTRFAVIDHAAVESADVKVATTKITTEQDATKYSGYFTADGVKYELASAYNEQALAIGNEYTLFFDETGFVIGAKVISEADATLDEIYFVAKEWDDESVKYGATVHNYYAQLINMKGEISEVELEALQSAEKTLVVLKDEKDSTNNYKADDEKYTFEAWSNDDFDATRVANYAGWKFTKDMTRFTLGNGTTFRFNSKTQYIIAEEPGKDLAVEVKTGGIALDGTSDMYGYVITADDSAVAEYVIIASAAEINGTSTFSSDLIYVVDATDYESGDGYIALEVIFADGSKKVINIDNGETVNSNTFYSYDTNDDGYYVLDAETPGITVTNGVWDDEEGVLVGVTFGDLFEDLLTVTGVADIDVATAKFVDAHDVDANGQYDSLVADLAALNALVDMEEYDTVATLSLSVEDDGAVIVILTGLTHTYNR